MTKIAIVDAHHHLWNIRENYHPWLCDEPPIAFRYGDYASLRRNYLCEDLLTDANAYNLVKSVYVETEWDPADPVGEVRWINDVAARDPLPNAIVAQAWLDRADVADVFGAYDEYPLVKGVRHKPRAAVAPGEVRIGAPGSMGCERWQTGYAMLAKHGLSFDLQTPWWHLAEALDLATTFPETQIILNHTGLPADRSDVGLSAWRDAMTALAQAPNVAVKISGLGQPGQPWTVAANSEVVLDTIRIFGTQRCMFASNFPVDSLVASYKTIFDGFATIVAAFSPSQQSALFHDNAVRIYRLTQ